MANIMDFVSVLQIGSPYHAVLLLIIALACIAMVLVARRYGGAPGRMLRRWVVYQAVLPLAALLLLILVYNGGKLGDLVRRVVLTGRGLLTLLLIAGILVGLALFKNRNSLRSRR